MINKLLNIKYPIIQGAMANIATPKFAASVSNSGGLGIIATGAMNPDEVREAICLCKTLTDKPFGVNVMLMNPYSEEIMNVIVQEKVDVVTTGAGNPGKYIDMLKESGCKVIPVVPTVALARRMENAGVDAVIVEGTEAGGHVGDITTMTLVPQVVDAVKIPVIAAGGIGDSRGFIAALSLGASGVQIATCLLVSEECEVHENYKEAILKAKDSDTIVTGRSAKVPVRILKNKMSREYLKLEANKATKEELEALTLGAMKKAVFNGDVDNGSVMTGQIAGLCNKRQTIQEILDDMVMSSFDILNSLSNLSSEFKNIGENYE